MTRRLKVSFLHCTRLRSQSRCSVIRVGSLRPTLFRIYRARRRGYQVEMLETLGTFGTGKEE